MWDAKEEEKKLIYSAILDSRVICHSYCCVSRKWQIQRLSFISLMELKMSVVQSSNQCLARCDGLWLSAHIHLPAPPQSLAAGSHPPQSAWKLWGEEQDWDGQTTTGRGLLQGDPLGLPFLPPEQGQHCNVRPGFKSSSSMLK